MNATVRETWDGHADEWDEQADDPKNYFSRRAAFVEQLVTQHVPPCSTLDFGCGPGNLSYALAKRGFDVHGCDIAPKMVEKAIRRLSGLTKEAESRFKITPGDTIPFGITFDLITAIDVIIYVPDYASFVQMLSRSLKPEGYLALSCTNNISFFTWLSIARLVANPRANPHPLTAIRNLARTGIWSGGHVDPKTSKQISSAGAFDRLFVRSGFAKIADFDMIHYRRWDKAPLVRRGLNRMIARRFGWNHVGLYRKRPDAAP
ncbi:MAG: class I SAM-dependent methyltransferase [Thermodesulfobacteriota bacterium]